MPRLAATTFFVWPGLKPSASHIDIDIDITRERARACVCVWVWVCVCVCSAQYRKVSSRTGSIKKYRVGIERPPPPHA